VLQYQHYLLQKEHRAYTSASTRHQTSDVLTKSAESIEMSFAAWTRVGSRNHAGLHLLRSDLDPLREGTFFGGGG